MCIKSAGLKDNLINRRDQSFVTYNVVLTFKNGTSKRPKKDAVIFISEKDLQNLYIEPHNSKKDLVVNGTKIKHKNIQTVQVTQSKFKKDEIPLVLKRMNRLYDEKKPISRVHFAEACEVITNNFVNTTTLLLEESKIFEHVNSKIRNASQSQYLAGLYSDAVFNALEVEIKARIPKSLENEELIKKLGVDLMNKTFNDNNPVLKIFDKADEQMGVKFLFAGAYGAIRNRFGHGANSCNKEEAIEFIYFANMLFRFLDNAKS